MKNWEIPDIKLLSDEEVFEIDTSFWIHIDDMVQKHRYIVPKYKILKCNHPIEYLCNDQDRYAFDPIIFGLSEYKMSLIATRYYHLGYLIRIDKYDYMSKYYMKEKDAIEMLMKERDVYVSIPKGSILFCPDGIIFPIAESITVLNRDLLPDSWKDSDILDEEKAYIKNGHLIGRSKSDQYDDAKDKHIGEWYEYLIPEYPVFFKVYVSEAKYDRISQIGNTHELLYYMTCKPCSSRDSDRCICCWLGGIIPCMVCERYVPIKGTKYSKRASMFQEKERGLYDTIIIC